MPDIPDVDDAVPQLLDGEFTTAGNYDPKLKAKAYDLFLSTDLSVTDIAIDLGLARPVLAYWIAKGAWSKRKREIEAQEMDRAEDNYRRLIIQNRGPVVERHLRVSGKLEKAIEKVIDEALKDDGIPSDMKLKRLAEALSSATGVSARAAAISDKPFSDENRNNDSGGKRPLVTIGLNVQAPPEAPMPSVTVTEED